MGVAVSPLAKDVIELPPTGGLDQSKAKFVMTPFHALTNVIFDKTGSLTKRSGFTAMASGVLDSYALASPTLVAANGDDLVSVGVRPEESPTAPGETGPYLWSYSAEAHAWAPKCGIPSLSVRRFPGVRGQNDLNGNPPVIARIGNVEALAWRDGNKAYVRLVDRSTGAVLLGDELVSNLPAGPAGKIALFACGGLFTFVWLNSTKTQIRVGTIHPTTLARSINFLATTYTSIALWDAIPTATGKWCWAGVDIAGTTDVVLQRVDNATAVADATTVEFGRGGTTISLGYVTGYNYLLLAWDDGTDVRAKKYTEATLATAVADWQVAALTTFTALYGVTCNMDDAYRPFILIDATDASGDDKLYLRPFGISGGSLTSLRQINHVSAQCKPFRLDGSLYVVVSRWFLTTPSVAETFGYALLNLSRNWSQIGNLVPAAFEGNFAPLDGRGLDIATSSQHYAWIDAISGKVAFPIVVYTQTGVTGRLDSPEARSWVDVIELDSSLTSERLWHRQAAQELLHLTAGTTVQYDGAVACEIAWLEPPQVIRSATLTYGTSGLEGDAVTPNAYTYYFLWEWVDAQGLVHRSRLSAPNVVSVATSGSDTHATVDFNLKTTNVTRRGGILHGDNTEPRLVAFRTLKNTSGPFYRCDWNGEVNATGDYSISFTDSEDDATLLAANRGEIYTTGGVLENETPPPARHVAVGGGRVWLTSAESPEVWPSKPLTNGEAPGFSPFLRITFDDSPGEIVGTAQLDSARVFFARDRIYALPSGGGPNATGSPPWGRPDVVQTSCGCASARSITEFRDGVIFRAVDTFKVLSRGFQVIDIGEAVKDLTDLYPTVDDAFLDAARERVVFALSGDSGAIFLVYDYRHTSPDGLGSWSQWTFEDATAGRACLWQDQIVWAQGDSPALESSGATPGYDDTGPGTTWVTAAIETPWVRLGALGGYQRVWRAVLELEKLSAHGLQVDVFTDGNDTTPVQTETWSVVQVEALQGLPRERLVIGLAVQKCQTIKVRVTDTEPAVAVDGDPTGFRYHGISFEIGRKRGVEKAEQDNWR